ncbi:peroxiredoxin [Psychromarinibacter halotolerans]|uniref:Glutathione-dependent peroxiredoxin n=1 Tax=Psychromarinibacter halotolerans TaxID=1775175 RepID=A0ABV7GMF5_9RHOB|nr:peroxiredoxin [Psychromarinibacter halotolerans]MDF0596012.1 peroxiredoxin [Psychromarinibacter halotolerans]
MALEVGDTFPGGTVLTLDADGRPTPVELGEKLEGRKVVIFALPGAFTGVCSTAHMPSFVRTADDIRGKGVDEVICLSVNDPFTLSAWGTQLGADDAEISMLADAGGEVTKALGQDFTAPPAGLYGRSKRYVCVVENGKITHVGAEPNPGECQISSGEAVLEAL